MPHQMGLRIAMQQQQWKTIPSFDKVDNGPTCVYLSLFKGFEHHYLLSSLLCTQPTYFMSDTAYDGSFNCAA